MPFGAHCVNDVVTVAPPPNHFRNQLGRILKIGIDDHYRGALRVFEPGSDSDLVSKISRKSNHAGVLIALMQIAQECRRSVDAAIIDIDDFVLDVGQRLEGRAQSTMRRFEDSLFIVTGRDDRNEHGCRILYRAGRKI